MPSPTDHINKAIEHLSVRFSTMDATITHLSSRLDKMAQLAGRVTAGFIAMAGLPRAFHSGMHHWLAGHGGGPGSGPTRPSTSSSGSSGGGPGPDDWLSYHKELLSLRASERQQELEHARVLFEEARKSQDLNKEDDSDAVWEGRRKRALEFHEEKLRRIQAVNQSLAEQLSIMEKIQIVGSRKFSEAVGPLAPTTSVISTDAVLGPLQEARQQDQAAAAATARALTPETRDLASKSQALAVPNFGLQTPRGVDPAAAKSLGGIWQNPNEYTDPNESKANARQFGPRHFRVPSWYNRPQTADKTLVPSPRNLGFPAGQQLAVLGSLGAMARDTAARGQVGEDLNLNMAGGWASPPGLGTENWSGPGPRSPRRSRPSRLARLMGLEGFLQPSDAGVELNDSYLDNSSANKEPGRRRGRPRIKTVEAIPDTLNFGDRLHNFAAGATHHLRNFFGSLGEDTKKAKAWLTGTSRRDDKRYGLTDNQLQSREAFKNRMTRGLTTTALGSMAVIGATASAGAPDALGLLTGSFRLIAAQIGQMLVPALVQFAVWAQDAYQWLRNLSPVWKDLLGWVITGVAGFSLLGTVIMKLAPVFSLLYRAGQLLYSGMNKWTIGIGLAVGAIALIISSFAKDKENKNEAQAERENREKTSSEKGLADQALGQDEDLSKLVKNPATTREQLQKALEDSRKDEARKREVSESVSGWLNSDSWAARRKGNLANEEAKRVRRVDDPQEDYGLKALQEGGAAGKTASEVEKAVEKAASLAKGKRLAIENALGKPLGSTGGELTDSGRSRAAGILMSITSTKAQPQYGAVEDAYKKVQLDVLGKDPLTRELEKINRESLQVMVQKLAQMVDLSKDQIEQLKAMGYDVKKQTGTTS